MTHDPDSKIVLRLPRAQKGRYVAASRAAGGTLAAWILATLDAAADPAAAAAAAQQPTDHPPQGESCGGDPPPR